MQRFFTFITTKFIGKTAKSVAASAAEKSQDTPKRPRRVTRKQINDVKGKKTCLQFLLKNPRAADPELQPFICEITILIESIIRLPRSVVDNRQTVLEEKLAAMMPLEQLLIRVIAGGEDTDKVKSEIFKRKYETAV